MKLEPRIRNSGTPENPDFVIQLITEKAIVQFRKGNRFTGAPALIIKFIFDLGLLKCASGPLDLRRIDKSIDPRRHDSTNTHSVVQTDNDNSANNNQAWH